MAVTIGRNIASLGAQRQLSESSTALAKTYEQLSSGLRINRASDDPAGLSIASNLNLDARVFNQAVRNVNDGISMLNIADGALNELANISMRQLELAEQAANGVYTLTQRRALNTEANALVSEYNRIVESTKFNGITLLDSTSTTDIRLQMGYGASNSIGINTTNLLSRVVGTGEFGGETTFSASGGGSESILADYNSDGNLDIFDSYGSILLGNGNGSFKAAVSIISGNGIYGATADLNGDTYADVLYHADLSTTVSVLLGNGNGTFKSVSTFTGGTALRQISLNDFNGDGIIDFSGANNTHSTFSIALGVGDGTFKSQTAYSINDSDLPRAITAGDINNDGKLDIITGQTNSKVSVALGNGDGSFSLASVFATGGSGGGANDVQLGDFNADGLLDLATANFAVSGSMSILLGNGNGSFKNATVYTAPTRSNKLELADFNGDGITDVVAANYSGGTDQFGLAIGNGDGTFKGFSYFSVSDDPYSIKAGDFNNDGVPDLVTPNWNGTSVSVFLQETQQVTTIARLDVLTQSSARNALDTISATLERISAQRGMIGAYQSRIEVTRNALAAGAENSIAAASRITDADIAMQSAQLVRYNILQKAIVGVLTQANQQPGLALELLSG